MRSVSFEGREAIPEAALLEAAGVRPGDSWPPGAGEEALRRLARWRYLASVAPPRVTPAPEDRVDVVFPIRERKLVGAVAIEGADAIDAADIQADLTGLGLRTGEPFVEGSLGPAEEAVLARCRRDGFLAAAVEMEARPAGPGRVDIAVRVVEGRRVHVREVRLEGARQVAASTALSYQEIQPRRLFGILNRGYYVPEDLESNLEALRTYYRESGFLSAQVELADIELNRALDSVRIVLRVEEGRRSLLEAVRIEGATSFPHRLLEKEAAVAAGGYYSGQAVEEGHLRLVRWYDEHSDILPRITTDRLYGEDDRVTVVFRIDEKHRHVETGTVAILGNRLTRDRVVRQDLALVPGRPFTLEERRRTEEALLRRGLYEAVQVVVERGSDPSRPEAEIADVEVRVQEKERTRMLWAGGGASSGSGGVAYVRVQHPNFDLFRLPREWRDWEGAFTGGGQLLDLEIVPGGRESNYQFRWMEPYFFRGDLALALTGSTGIYDRSTYDETRLRAVVELEKFFDPDRHVSASLGYVADLARIHDLDSDAPPDAVEAEGRTLLGYPRFELRYDGQDLNYYSGPTGVLASAGFAIGDDLTGSELDFARWTAAAGVHLGLVDSRPDYRHVLHAGLHAGWIDGLGGDDIPLFERFYLGGPRSFRGFRYRRLGPHQAGSPVGGEWLLHGTVQYSLPLFWREIRGFALFDWGDLEEEVAGFSTGRFRTAAGVGLTLRLRMLGQPFPATFYWVKALASEPEDREQLFSFTLGLTF